MNAASMLSASAADVSTIRHRVFGDIRKAGWAGQACPGADLAVFDENDLEVSTGEVGELVVGAKFVMKGYWRNPEAPAIAIRDGWFHTADMAREDEEVLYKYPRQVLMAAES